MRSSYQIHIFFAHAVLTVTSYAFVNLTMAKYSAGFSSPVTYLHIYLRLRSTC